MRFFVVTLTLLILGGIQSLHYFGSQVKHSQPPKENAGKTDELSESPAPTDPYDERPPKPKKAELPPEPPAIRLPTTVLLTINAEAGQRRMATYPVLCFDGPADRRVHLLPLSPQMLVKEACDAIWVPAFQPFEAPRPEPDPTTTAPKKDRPLAYSVAYGGIVPDALRMELESIGVYVIEQATDGYRLSFEGKMNVDDFAKLLEKIRVKDTTGAAAPIRPTE